jgi:hypothetical protein
MCLRASDSILRRKRRSKFPDAVAGPGWKVSPSGAGSVPSVGKYWPKVIPGLTRAHLLALLKCNGHALFLFPDSDDAGFPQMAQFDIRQFAGLTETFQVEAAGAASRYVHCSVEGLHFGVLNRQAHVAVVPGFIFETALGGDIQGARGNRGGTF